MTTQRASATILAELTEIRAARTALLKGERVEDVSRDGRRMKMSSASLADLNAAIADLTREYEAAVAVEAGKRNRSAIGIRF